MKPPSRPCGSCPYRCDVPPGVWHESEYAKLPEYDNETGDQPLGVFMCHQQDGSVCSGWAHAADEDTLALRFMADQVMAEAVIEYQSPIPTFGHTEAAEHGMTGYVEGEPGDEAERVQDRLARKGIGK